MAGRKALPSVLKNPAGNAFDRNGHRANAHEPKPKAARLTVPPVLKGDKAATAAYRMYAKRALDLGVMTEWDDTAMAMLAKAHAELWEHESALKTEGYKRKDEGPNPRVRMRDKAAERLLILLREFGMTASARSGIRPTGAGGGRGLAERIIPTLEAEQIAKDAENWEPPAVAIG